MTRMKKTQGQRPDAIDAVITWVNGSSDQHLAKRKHFTTQSFIPLHENAINPHRWLCNDEIMFCLQSIHNFAPWTRRIWILVDDETPDISGLPASLQKKITFAFHSHIFRGYKGFLPTFNSLAIESMLWRIDGLAEHFMYFNDDVFLTATLDPSDVFQAGNPVLRGKWADYSDFLSNDQARDDPAKFNHFMQINAAAIEGFEATNLFATAHVVHPFIRSKMAQLFAKHQEAFLRNISHRFRDLSQFLPQGLHNHACISDQKVVLRGEKDHIHIYSGQGNEDPPLKTHSTLKKVTNTTDIKFLCINDLPQLELLIPNIRSWLSDAIGGFNGSDIQP